MTWFLNMQLLHKIKSKHPNSPEVHTPPLAVQTQVTALAILFGTRLKWYRKLLIYKCNKHSSELILFPYRTNFHSAAIFPYKPSSCICNDHSACNVPYRHGETWTTHKNRSQEQLREFPLLPTAAIAQQHIPGWKGWWTRNSHPSPSNDVGTAFPSPKERYFFLLGGLSERKEWMLLWLKWWLGIQVLGSICSVISCLIYDKTPG